MVLRSLIHRAPYKSKLRLSDAKQRFIISSTQLQLRARQFGTAARNVEDGSRIRNIGIIAHIDAGKTTTTERMLYYSGHTRRIGDVDDGSTVTDFLPAERARGITIQSAAITFDWPPAAAQTEASTTSVNSRSVIPHHINLIDTPGHADFTFEVRRSIRVLDGAVCILDGVAGVEAQTEQVWNQAGDWKIPRIIYINKLDRDGAAFGRAVREVGSRLGGSPAVCQIPWFAGGRGNFTGVADVVNLRAFKYDSGSDGKHIKEYSLPEIDAAEPGLGQEIRRARTALIELLSLADESMVETFLEAEADHMAVTPQAITTSIRWCLLEGEYPIIPVFAGASFRNIGVQPLLNAVNDLLPGPEERPDPDVSIGLVSGGLSQLLRGDLLNKSNTGLAKTKKSSQLSLTAVAKLSGCALAFKVVNDPRKGMLVYIRVYSGTINKNDVLFNTNLQVSERAQNLLRMYASESVSIQSIEAGQIGVIAGSKSARTGDTLISYQGPRGMPPEPLNQLQLRPIHVPPPVFFAAIEPNSLKEEKDMHEKLALLLREDPSLHVNQDEDTGQTLLSGMGELHLEIARDRLVNDLKANARMGPITIGYRETLTGASDDISKLFDKDRSEAKGKAGCTASVRPLDEKNMEDSDEEDSSVRSIHDGNEILIVAPTLDRKGKALNSDNVSLPSHLTLQEIQAAYLNGALAALSRGPTHSYPVRNVEVRIKLHPEQHLFGTDTTTSSLASAARLATIAAFKDSVSKSPTALMEPVMNVDISVPDNALGKVVQDISSARGGHIVSLGEAEETAANSNVSTDSNAESATHNVHDARRHFYAPPDPWESTDTHNQHIGVGEAVNLQRTVKAKVPLKEMVGYLKHLRSMTGGRGTFVMSVDRFERMTAVRERAVIIDMRGG